MAPRSDAPLAQSGHPHAATRAPPTCLRGRPDASSTRLAGEPNSAVQLARLFIIPLRVEVDGLVKSARGVELGPREPPCGCLDVELPGSLREIARTSTPFKSLGMPKMFALAGMFGILNFP